MGSEVLSLRIVLFAGAREIVGLEEVLLELRLGEEASGLKAEAVLQRLGELYPRLGDLLPSCRLAVDCEFVSGETLIDRSANELALIPPVSGG
ncbi:MAG: MoaD/ThiS family protein [Rubripirellula sp.]